MLEYFFDIARSFTDLLVSGTARRFLDIKWIVTHCGGSLPSVIDRLVLFVDYLGAQFQEFRHGGKIRKEDIECAMREQFWLDLAGNPLSNLVDALLKLSSKERFLFRSDVPWTPFKVAEQVVRHLEKDMRKNWGERSRDDLARECFEALGQRGSKEAGAVRYQLASPTVTCHVSVFRRNSSDLEELETNKRSGTAGKRWH